LADTELSLNKTSKLFGPVRTSYEDLTEAEKRLVTQCYKNRYPSNLCKSRCRFSEICNTF